MGQIQPSVLFLVHIEESFRFCFPVTRSDGYRGTEWIARLRRACRHHDRVIALVSHVEDDHCIEELHPFVHEEWEWSWGYHPRDEDDTIFFADGLADEWRGWVIPADGHQYTWVPPGIRSPDWKHWHITVAGGCLSECLADWENVLRYMGLTYRRPWRYTY